MDMEELTRYVEVGHGVCAAITPMERYPGIVRVVSVSGDGMTYNDYCVQIEFNPYGMDQGGAPSRHVRAGETSCLGGRRTTPALTPSEGQFTNDIR